MPFLFNLLQCQVLFCPILLLYLPFVVKKKKKVVGFWFFLLFWIEKGDTRIFDLILMNGTTVDSLIFIVIFNIIILYKNIKGDLHAPRAINVR